MTSLLMELAHLLARRLVDGQSRMPKVSNCMERLSHGYYGIRVIPDQRCLHLMLMVRLGNRNNSFPSMRHT